MYTFPLKEYFIILVKSMSMVSSNFKMLKKKPTNFLLKRNVSQNRDHKS